MSGNSGEEVNRADVAEEGEIGEERGGGGESRSAENLEGKW